MWTPRRVLVLLGTILLFGGTYWIYSRLLGRLDGLPRIPAQYLVEASGILRPRVTEISPTDQKLSIAFGPNCPEASDLYPDRFEFRKGETSIVLAASMQPKNPEFPKNLVFCPFSAAVFGKPQLDGSVEISTFHADRAVITFDRSIDNPTEMHNANPLSVELISDPENVPPDPRRGLVEVRNNQRSTDPNKALILRTVGPVFYRNKKEGNAQADSGPDIWTDASVEIVDRQNLPRDYHCPPPETTRTKGEYARGADLRENGVVASILAGQRLPPPTVTALGMRIYMQQPEKAAPAKSDSSGFSGVKKVELREKVLFNLWVDSHQSLVSTPVPEVGKKPEDTKKPDEEAPKSANPLAMGDPPTEAAAVVGACHYGIQTVRRLDRALLQVETLGSFSFDVEKSLAHFDVIPQADPNVPNDVQLHRILRRAGSQQLFSQFLEIEFDDPSRNPPAKEAEKKPDAARKPNTAAQQNSGLSFKQLHAWTDTPMRLLTVASSEKDENGKDIAGFEAYGRSLVHDQLKNRTTLVGAPLYLVRANPLRDDEKPSGSNRLEAGSSGKPAQLILENSQGPEPTTVATVLGPGKMELFDEKTQANTIQASWEKSLVQTKDRFKNRELDLLTFSDAAEFRDTEADYWLRARTIKLWLEGGQSSPNKPGENSQAKPNRLQAVGDVTGHSADFDVEQSDHLNVLFRDGLAPPKKAEAKEPPAKEPQPQAKSTPAPSAAPGAAPAAIAEAPVAPVAPVPPQSKPPMKLRARLIETWVKRYPLVPEDDGWLSVDPPDEPTLKYEVERSRCEGNVMVHQDPTLPPPGEKGQAEEKPKPRGLDIFGNILLVERTTDGSVMTVIGLEPKPGEVHREDVSIIGPEIIIDELHNRVDVKGRGNLVMPAGSELNGGELQSPASTGKGNDKTAKAGDKKANAKEKPPGEMIIHWRDGMTFQGARKEAEFRGRVQAVQGDSYVRCHTMQVGFDRPIYFNQFRDSDNAEKPRKARQIVEEYLNAVKERRVADATRVCNMGAVAGTPNTIGDVHRLIGPKGVSLATVVSSDAKGRAVAVSETISFLEKGSTGPVKRCFIFVLLKGQSGWLISEIGFAAEEFAAKTVDEAKRIDGATESDNPKIEVVYCYPAPDDARDEMAGAKDVVFREMNRDENGKVIKSQHLTARELVMKAQCHDANGEQYQEVIGYGPGTVRVWQLGQKDMVGAGAPNEGGKQARPAPKAQQKQNDGQAKKDDDSEMKLTIVNFGGRMTIKDKAKIYQEATFTDSIEAVNVQADDPGQLVEWHRLPPGSIWLKCAEKLIISSHTVQPEAPPDQRMYAYGNVTIQTDEYTGWGEVMTGQGPLVTLYGTHPDRPKDNNLARINSRYRGDSQSGKKIVYDRVKGNYNVEESFGATFQQSLPPVKPPTPQPGSSNPTRPPTRPIR